MGWLMDWNSLRASLAAACERPDVARALLPEREHRFRPAVAVDRVGRVPGVATGSLAVGRLPKDGVGEGVGEEQLARVNDVPRDVHLDVNVNRTPRIPARID